MTKSDDGAPKGKKRAYTMSAKARSARQKAALKHGGRAKLSTLASAVAAKGGAGLTAADRRHFARLEEALNQAVTRGDRSMLEPHIVAAMAPLVALLQVEATKLYLEGLMVTKVVKAGEGEKDIKVDVVNPRRAAVIQLARLMGLEGKQQGTTPTAAVRDASAVDTVDAHWEWHRRMLQSTDPDQPAGDDDAEAVH